MAAETSIVTSSNSSTVYTRDTTKAAQLERR